MPGGAAWTKNWLTFDNSYYTQYKEARQHPLYFARIQGEMAFRLSVAMDSTATARGADRRASEPRCVHRKGATGVSTHGVTAIIMFIDRGTFWVLPLIYFYIPNKSRAYLFPQSDKTHYFCRDPISADPICPQPSGADRLAAQPLCVQTGRGRGKERARSKPNTA